MGIHLHGMALIDAGRVAEGMALLDEAMASAIAGELGTFFTGVVYCNVIAACLEVSDVGRLGEWNDAAGQRRPSLARTSSASSHSPGWPCSASPRASRTPPCSRCAWWSPTSGPAGRGGHSAGTTCTYVRRPAREVGPTTSSGRRPGHHAVPADWRPRRAGQ
jgi:hypothetical protein